MCLLACLFVCLLQSLFAFLPIVIHCVFAQKITLPMYSPNWRLHNQHMMIQECKPKRSGFVYFRSIQCLHYYIIIIRAIHASAMCIHVQYTKSTMLTQCCTFPLLSFMRFFFWFCFVFGFGFCSWRYEIHFRRS